MSNAFPKSYILERIAAKKASLESKIATGERLVAEYDTDEVKQAVIDFMGKQAEELRDTAKRATKYAAKATVDMPAGELHEYASKMDFRVQSSPPNTALHGYASRYGVSDTKRDEARKAWQERNEARSELAKLDHAEAYLKDTPVDEFTITGLKQLGLLDAVKFHL